MKSEEIKSPWREVIILLCHQVKCAHTQAHKRKNNYFNWILVQVKQHKNLQVQLGLFINVQIHGRFCDYFQDYENSVIWSKGDNFSRAVKDYHHFIDEKRETKWHTCGYTGGLQRCWLEVVWYTFPELYSHDTSTARAWWKISSSELKVRAVQATQSQNTSCYRNKLSNVFCSKAF